MSSYRQLTQQERYQMYALKQAGHSQSEVAEVLERDRSTISRELRRNRGLRGYRPAQAHRKAMERRRAKVPPRFSSPLWPIVEGLIRQDWSPEQISGRLLHEHGLTISHETIYQYIYADKAAGGDLHRHLRCQKKRRKRYGGRDRRGRIPNQRSIEERPEEVDRRSRLGDWEGDTVIGKGHQGALVTAVERRSRFTVIGVVSRKTSAAVTESLVDELGAHSGKVLTLTLDNGREFAGHEEFAGKLDADVFFAHPYSSWERGTNENTNGLIRKYFPKNRNLRDVTREEVRSTTERLNNRPRKVLDYRTPCEVFFNKEQRITVALGT